MSEEEIEQKFQYALDEILSLVKGETATEIVMREQPMILLFKGLIQKIKNRDYLISKQQKEIGELKDEAMKKELIIKEKIKELEKSENVGISDIYEIKKEFAIEILKGLL